MPADFAKPQVYPGVAHFQAFLAALRFGFRVTNLIDVCASVRHVPLLDLPGSLNRDAHREAGITRHGVHGNLAMQPGHDAIDKIES